MTDIASFGFSIDSNPAVTAAQNLDRMSMSAQMAQGTVGGLTTANQSYVRALEETVRQQSGFITALTNTQTIAAGLGTSIANLGKEAGGLNQTLGALADTVERRVTASLRAMREENERASNSFRGVDIKSWTEEAQRGFALLYQEAERFFRLAGNAPASLLQFQYVTERIGLTTRETGEAITRLTEAMRGISTEGRNVREVLGRYNVQAGDPSTTAQRFAERALGAPASAQRTMDIMAVFGTNDPDIVNRLAGAGGSRRGENAMERDTRLRSDADIQAGIQLRATAETVRSQGEEAALVMRRIRTPDFFDRLSSREGQDPLARLLQASDYFGSAQLAGRQNLISADMSSRMETLRGDFRSEGWSGWVNPMNYARLAGGMLDLGMEGIGRRVSATFNRNYPDPLYGTADEVAGPQAERVAQAERNMRLQDEITALSGRMSVGTRTNVGGGRGVAPSGLSATETTRLRDLQQQLAGAQARNEFMELPPNPVRFMGGATGWDAVPEADQDRSLGVLSQWGITGPVNQVRGQRLNANFEASRNLFRVFGADTMSTASQVLALRQNQLADPTFGAQDEATASLGLAMADPSQRLLMSRMQAYARQTYGSPNMRPPGMGDIAGGMSAAIFTDNQAYLRSSGENLGNFITQQRSIRSVLGEGGAAAEDAGITEQSRVFGASRGMSGSQTWVLTMQRLNEAQERRNTLLEQELVAQRQTAEQAERYSSAVRGAGSTGEYAQAQIDTRISDLQLRYQQQFGKTVGSSTIAGNMFAGLSSRSDEFIAQQRTSENDLYGQLAAVQTGGPGALQATQTTQDAIRRTSEQMAAALRMEGQARDEAVRKVNEQRDAMIQLGLSFGDLTGQIRMANGSFQAEAQGNITDLGTGLNPRARAMTDRAGQTLTGMFGPTFTNMPPEQQRAAVTALAAGQGYTRPGDGVPLFSNDDGQRFLNSWNSGRNRTATEIGEAGGARDSAVSRAVQILRSGGSITDAQIAQAQGASGEFAGEQNSMIARSIRSQLLFQSELQARYAEGQREEVMAGAGAIRGGPYAEQLARLGAQERFQLRGVNDPEMQTSIRRQFRNQRGQLSGSVYFGQEEQAYREDEAYAENEYDLSLGAGGTRWDRGRSMATFRARRESGRLLALADNTEDQEIAGSLRARAGGLEGRASRAVDMEEQLQTMRVYREIAGDATRVLSQGFQSAVLYGQKVSDVISQISLRLGDVAMRAALKPVENAIEGSLGGAFSSVLGLGSGSAGGAAQFTNFATNANPAGLPDIAFMARGGVVLPAARGRIQTTPMVFPMAGGNVGMIGEAGPEGVLPLRRNASGELGVVAVGGGGGGGLSIGDINISVSGGGANGSPGDPGTYKQFTQELGKAVRDQVMSELRTQTRPGGMLTGQQMVAN